MTVPPVWAAVGPSVDILVEGHAADVLPPDVTNTGGSTALKTIAAIVGPSASPLRLPPSGRRSLSI